MGSSGVSGEGDGTVDSGQKVSGGGQNVVISGATESTGGDWLEIT